MERDNLVNRKWGCDYFKPGTKGKRVFVHTSFYNKIKPSFKRPDNLNEWRSWTAYL